MGLRRGPWALEEDKILVAHIQRHGHANWRTLPEQAGLQRCGKSCRLRWLNYLRPDIKRGNFTREEEDTIIRLHQKLGNRWSAIAAQLPGRTDNEIKNVWHTHLKKRLVGSDQIPESCSTADQRRRKRARRCDDSSNNAAHPTPCHVPIAPSPSQPCSSPSSSYKSELPSSRNLVESPSSTVTTTTAESAKSGDGDDCSVDEKKPQINDYKGRSGPSPSDTGSMSMHSNQAWGDPLLSCNGQQDEEEEGVDDFWLKLLMEADAITGALDRSTLDQLFFS